MRYDLYTPKWKEDLGTVAFGSGLAALIYGGAKLNKRRKQKQNGGKNVLSRKRKSPKCLTDLRRMARKNLMAIMGKRGMKRRQKGGNVAKTLQHIWKARVFAGNSPITDWVIPAIFKHLVALPSKRHPGKAIGAGLGMGILGGLASRAVYKRYKAKQ